MPLDARQTLPMYSNQHKTVRGKSFTNNAEKRQEELPWRDGWDRRLLHWGTPE